MTQDEFSQYISTVKTFSQSYSSTDDSITLIYDCIIHSLKEDGYTELYEDGKKVAYQRLSNTEVTLYELKILLCKVQHAFNYKGYKTKPYKKNYTAYIWEKAPNCIYCGCIINNDTNFK